MWRLFIFHFFTPLRAQNVTMLCSIDVYIEELGMKSIF